MSKTVQQVVLVIDEAIKERAKIALRANGISLKDGADDLMRRIVESSRLPFRIDRDPKLHNAGITETMRRFFEIDEEWPDVPTRDVNMSMRVDRAAYAAAQKKLDDYGIPGTVVLRAFLTQCAYEMRLPY